MKKIFIFNTLTRQKEPLDTLTEGEVKMYACGVTTYDHCHVGHAMQAIYFDVMRRFLTHLGYKVTYVRNFTDVDDKIIARAAERGVRPDELAAEMVESCRRDMQAIGVAPADQEPKVSESIPAIIQMIETLIQAGAAYATDKGDVYYRVKAKPDYGKLSNQDVAKLQSGSRHLKSSDKEDELDFALWKRESTPGAFWDSPWGEGRPGWHIECSAMVKKHLGSQIDIHGGGRDLIFPHHENEIAQSESANQTAYANIWIHSGLLTINHQKMSKSLGNHISIQDFLKDWPAEVLRMCVLANLYSSNIDFSKAAFIGAAKRLLYFYESLGIAREFVGNDCAPNADIAGTAIGEFEDALCDDFNSVKFQSLLCQRIRRLNELRMGKATDERRKEAAGILQAIGTFSNIVGLLTEEPASFIEKLKEKILPHLGFTREQIDEKIRERKLARDRGDYATSDKIRDELLARGIGLNDGAQTTSWVIQFTDDTDA